jgi:UDP-glucose 4-epimerase/UDP-arabinose 4-epimerase
MESSGDRPAILVAGGAGYIGSHTCKALSAAGFLPVTVDDLSTGHAQAVQWGPLVEGDIADGELVTATIRRHRVAGAMHFAAFSIVSESVMQPFKYYENNVVKALAFARTLVELGVEPFVFSSSAAVYGLPTAAPIPESHPTNPINAYGATKLAFEGVLRALGAAYPLRSLSLRYFNAAGADPEGQIGESHEPETHLIPNIAKAALGQAPALQIFGDDYDTPDGTAVRDYVHVADVAEAHVAALRRLLEGGGSEVMNVGSSLGASVAEVLAVAEQVLGRPVPHVIGPRRPGDPPSLVADASRLRSRLDWVPHRSDLETLIATTVNWQRRRPF